MITLGIWLAERGMLPDFILRVAVKFLSKARLRMPNVFSEKLKVLNTLKEGPIAESTSSANEQHYEVPPIFFEKVLGENLKYSCCLYDDDNKDLNSAEIFMLDKYLDRADIKSNQEILDLGCGWGSFTLHAAKKFPQSNFTSISNSKDQIDFINESFAPTSEEIAEGKKVLEEYQKSGGGAVKIDGQMVDEPIAEAMRLKISLGEEENED